MNTTNLPRSKAGGRAKAQRAILTHLTLQLWRSERVRRNEQTRQAGLYRTAEQPFQPFPQRPPR